MSKTANRFNCMECGRSVTSVEYHPYWHCVLHKVGQLDQALKEIEAIHQQEIAKARLNEVQSAYEYWINGRKFISSYFRDRIAELSSSKEGADNE